VKNIEAKKEFVSGWTLDAINIKNKECKSWQFSTFW